MCKLQNNNNNAVAEEPERGARVQRLRPLLQITQCKNSQSILQVIAKT